jgi:hypothetical protein
MKNPHIINSLKKVLRYGKRLRRKPPLMLAVASMLFIARPPDRGTAQPADDHNKPPAMWKTLKGAAQKTQSALPFAVHGFSEGALGWLPAKNRLIRNHSFNMMEGRVQLKTLYYPEKPAFLLDWGTALAARVDFVGDGIAEDFRVEFRELNGRTSPLSWTDLKIGRQIFTWGTGDLIFVNDLFPKDWVSFLIGRDDEYLKRPSDALKASAFSRWANVDFILIPFFAPDNPIRGERLSFYDPIAGKIVGEDNNLHFNRPSDSIDNMEYAARIYRSLGSYELALYGFKGFYKQAVGIEDYATGDLFYPRIISTGSSVRGPVPKIGGIGNLEWAWYHSDDDSAGTNPMIENSQLRYLAGYERTLWTDFTAGLQYYVEEMLHRGAYKRHLPPDAPFTQDEFRQVVTIRLTQRLFSQNATASVFAFFSPTDEDFYIRPRFSWNLTDHWNLTVGANCFGGAHSYTMFGQFRNDNAVYSRIRYSF